MTTTVQERLQLKRAALDNWTVREKLCLASAVSCSGDQNWMSVSRSLKMMCGPTNRPADWFSQKSCAVQYGELLENVETPKRKKRTISERDNQITETPTESILRKLTQERIAELKAQIQKDREECAKLRDDVMLVQSNVSEAKLKEMVAQIDQEQEQKLNEQQKYAQWLKQRDQRKSELQKAWRLASSQQPQSDQQGLKAVQASVQKFEDMDVDEVNVKHGTAPLLTSLLKSPSQTPSTTSSTPQASLTPTTNVRISAPTITNLLTGNTTTQIASVATVTSTKQFHALHTQPLTGPTPIETPQQNTQSPSQAAPTLSMLLENKNKEANEQVIQSGSENINQPQSSEVVETTASADSPNKDEDQQLMEVFNELIPDNIDELEDILSNELNPELLEEESILEDVESLIDEQQNEVTDVKGSASTKSEETTQPENQPEVMSSKNMPESTESMNGKEEIKEENENSLDPENIPKIKDSSGSNINEQPKSIEEVETVKDEKIETEPEPMEVDANEKDPQAEVAPPPVEKAEPSDDSSDDTTLQNLKNKIYTDCKSEDSPIAHLEDKSMQPVVLICNEINVISSATIESSKILENTVNKSAASEIKADSQTEDNKSVSEEVSDVIIINEDSLSNDGKMDENTEKVVPEPTVKSSPSPNRIKITEEKFLQQEISSGSSAKLEQKTVENPLHLAIKKELKIELTPASITAQMPTPITITDTDEDSTAEIVKEEPVNKRKRDYSRSKKTEAEKKAEEHPPVEESKQNLSIRKLRDRDRSESPLVEDDLDSLPRTRRRYSSTPVIDSIPSSPASSDDREYKAWKKSILMIYNRIASHRHASIFLRPVTEDMAPKYKIAIYRPMDLQTIKRNIDNGVIRTTIEFQRDVLGMCQNAIMYNRSDNNVYNMAKEMMRESIAIMDSLVESSKRDNEKAQNIPSAKGRSRKNYRLP